MDYNLIISFYEIHRFILKKKMDYNLIISFYEIHRFILKKEAASFISHGNLFFSFISFYPDRHSICEIVICLRTQTHKP